MIFPSNSFEALIIKCEILVKVTDNVEMAVAEILAGDKLSAQAVDTLAKLHLTCSYSQLLTQLIDLTVLFKMICLTFSQ